jgi:tRNA1(Val) A37 N6-methylase TrmN6
MAAEAPGDSLTGAGATTEDAILGGRLRLVQPAAGYRVGIDPVFLAAAAPDGTRRVLDLGCGVGTAGLCLARRLTGAAVTGLELQPELAALARRNAVLNDLEGRVSVHEGDLLRPPPAVEGGGFDLVLANPPFLEAGRATAPAEPGRALGHIEGEAGLADWIGQGLKLAAPRGRLILIHRPDRLGEILAALDGRAGGIVVFPLWPAAGKPARRIIVAATKGSGAPLTLSAGLVMHEADGRYAAAAEAVLRQGGGLSL